MRFQNANKNTNWDDVAAAGASSMLPAGGYVAGITDVEDVEKSEYLRFTFDIVEGEHAGFFKNENRVYVHQFVRSYKPKAMGFMKQFLECVEASNPDFKLSAWDSDPNALRFKKVGIIVQREDYTNGKGEDRARMNVEGFASADDIRAGRYKLPEPKDNRAVVPAAAAGADSADVYSDVPF